MKGIVEYINENIEDLRALIIDKIGKIDNEKLLKSISKKLNISGNYDNYVKIIKNRLNYCGISDKITKSLIQKIAHYDCIDIFGETLNKLKPNENDTNDKNITYLKSSDILKHNNIYDLIMIYINTCLKSIDSDIKIDDDDLYSLLQDIADFDLHGKVTVGKMEFLCAMFLNDLNPGNTKSDNNNVCDINCNKNRFEFKISSGRLSGNKDESKPYSPENLDNAIFEEIKKNIGEKDYDEEIKNIQPSKHIFENESNFKMLIDELIRIFDNDYELISKIIINTLLSQFDKSKIKNVISDIDISYLAKKYTITNADRNDGIKKFKQLFLILHLLNYWNYERFTHLILFDNNGGILSGDYVVLKMPENDTNDPENSFITQIETIISTNNIKCDQFPRYGNGSANFNWAPTIIYSKK